MDLGLSGRRAAVAASSRGLGFACASALAAEGARVAVGGRSEPAVRAAADRLGGGAVPMVADVASAAGARQFVGQATEALGGLDILVTNAGGPPPGNFASTAFDRYPEALALNLLSVVAMCQAAVPAMQAQRFGRVVAFLCSDHAAFITGAAIPVDGGEYAGLL